jgi:cation diffusion facilitator family transporter
MFGVWLSSAGKISEVLESDQVRKRLAAISTSFIVGALLMGIKFYVYWLTGSSAILSDALESIINVVASAFALGSILFAAKPPDPTHPYGHGKIEYFSAGFEGALIVFAALGIGWTAWPQILNPHELPHLQSGLLILLGASAINLVLGMGLVRAGKHTRSLVLVADGKHVLTDVYTSTGVLLGLLLVKYTGWYWMDGAIAFAVAANILFIGVKLMRESFKGLMDASDPALLEEISRLIARHRRPNWIDVHRLRAWRSGDRLHVDFHVILPRDLTLEQAHREVSDLQEILDTHLEGVADALIHAEPCVDPHCPICGHDPCTIRQEPVRRQSLWQRETLTAPAEEKIRSAEAGSACDDADGANGHDDHDDGKHGERR